MRSFLGRYAAFFRPPGIRRFVLLSFLARMPMGTLGLSTLLHVRELTGWFAFAGSVVGAGMAAGGALIGLHGVESAFALAATSALAAGIVALGLSRR